MLEKIAIVTGGSSEIGKAIIEKLLGDGIGVAAQYNSNQINIKNENLIPIQCSFENQMEVENFIKKVLSLEFSIGYLVNSAGYIENNSFLNTNSEDLRRVFEVNLFAHIQLMQRIFPNMCELEFGRIVTLSSIGVKYSGSQNSVYYSASKVALEAVTRSFAKFGAGKNVLCNNIRVGVIDTKIHHRKNMQERMEKIPLKRFGTTQDIAEMVSFLCSERANFITGQEIAVSGGE
ncbi:SDR family NAD(P)-dependent oxidoreductase [Leptospira sp. 96542]|nr:SDR family NAD(P)-dependent oxidoreductase [Leptospira sp. 96542]